MSEASCAGVAAVGVGSVAGISMASVLASAGCGIVAVGSLIAAGMDAVVLVAGAAGFGRATSVPHCGQNFTPLRNDAPQ